MPTPDMSRPPEPPLDNSHNKQQSIDLTAQDTPLVRPDPTKRKGLPEQQEDPYFTRPNRSSLRRVGLGVGAVASTAAVVTPPEKVAAPEAGPVELEQGEEPPHADSSQEQETPAEEHADPDDHISADPPNADEAPDTGASTDGGDNNDEPPDNTDTTNPDPDEPDGFEELVTLLRAKISTPPWKDVRDFDRRAADRQADFYKAEEELHMEWREHYWPAHDSSLTEGTDSFENWFKDTVPEGRSLKEDIETTLEPLPSRIGIELGGVGSELFSGFTDGFFSESYGVCLTDTRHATFDRSAILDRDDRRNHDVITGNLMHDSTIQKVDEKLAGRKAGLIIERMYYGESALPHDPFTLADNTNKWYERLAEGGLLIAQIPPGLTPFVDEWKEMIKNTAPALEVQTSRHGRNDEFDLIRLHKRPGSPESLPLLSARSLVHRRQQLIKNLEDLM